jgi:hypothetical protein
MLRLKDQGYAPDLQAGDGVYSATWRPPGSGVYTFSFSNGETATVRVR